MTVSVIYQVIVRCGRQCRVEVFPPRFGHRFSHTWLDRAGAEGDRSVPAIVVPSPRQSPASPPGRTGQRRNGSEHPFVADFLLACWTRSRRWRPWRSGCRLTAYALNLIGARPVVLSHRIAA